MGIITMNKDDFINFHEQNTVRVGGVCYKVTNCVLISEFVKKQGVKKDKNQLGATAHRIQDDAVLLTSWGFIFIYSQN